MNPKVSTRQIIVEMSKFEDRENHKAPREKQLVCTRETP